MRSLLVSIAACLLAACGSGPSGAPLPNPFARWQYHCEAPITAGQACENDQACAPGLHCAPGTKTCTAPGGKGAVCETNRGCLPALACKYRFGDNQCFTMKCDASGNNCQQDRPTGRTCNPGETCNAGELCVGGASLPATCQDRVPAGGACDSYATNPCQPGFICQIGTARCVPMPTAGQTCGIPLNGVACAPGLSCIQSANGSSLCGASIAIGQHCDSSGGECVKGAHCNLRNLKCEANVGVGDSCPNGNECGEAPFDTGLGLECVQGECVDTSKAGAKCWPNDPSQCTNGRVCRKD